MTITKMLDELQFGRTEPIVRVNSVDSGLAEDDIKAVMEAESLPPTWMIPKVDDPMHIQWVSFFHFCTCSGSVVLDSFNCLFICSGQRTWVV